MRRVYIACLAALAALSAQAVTIDWNTAVDWGEINWRNLNTTKVDGGGAWRDIGHIGTNASAAVLLNVRFGDLPDAGCLLMLGGTKNSGGTGGIKLSVSEGGALSASLQDDTGGGWRAIEGSANLQTGLNQVAMAIDRTELGSQNYQAVISIFVNGEKAFSYEGYFGGVTFNRVSLGCDTGLTDNISGLTSNYNLHYASSANSNDNYTGVGQIEDAYEALLLPEPTALALLALGVAGLALRRKAA